MAAEDWYTINDIDKLDTPVLVVYPSRVKQNIDTAIGMVDNVARLRPHVKTHKSGEVTRLMLQAGITKFKCATIAEAEMLGMGKAPDVLLAYQPIGPKLDRFIRLISLYPNTKFSCLVDNIQAAAGISETAIKKGVKVPVYIDINVGQNRTGIKPGELALALYVNCQALTGMEIVGLHAYDGHIHGADLATRTLECDRCFEEVVKLQSEIVADGIQNR